MVEKFGLLFVLLVFFLGVGLFYGLLYWQAKHRNRRAAELQEWGRKYRALRVLEVKTDDGFENFQCKTTDEIVGANATEEREGREAPEFHGLPALFW